jgi:hypothetical protein
MNGFAEYCERFGFATQEPVPQEETVEAAV